MARRYGLWGSEASNVRASRGAIACIQVHLSYSLCWASACLRQRKIGSPVQPAQQLVADMIYNELNDRGCDSFWQYGNLRVSGSQNVDREQVETPICPASFTSLTCFA
jgi:hypothetical protein